MFLSWRHPFLAPLYAGLISFAFVVLFGAVLGPPPQTVIRVVADGVDPLPPELAELSIRIRKPDGRNQDVGGGKIDNRGSYTPDVSVANHLVCIQPQPPAPWKVIQPATNIVDQPNPVTCTAPIPNPPDKEIVLKLVKGATVRAMADGPTPNSVPKEFAGVLVEIREPDGAKGTEMGWLDAMGQWVLPRQVADRLVCLHPPLGWMVTAPPTTDQQGTKCVKASGDDIVFTLGRTR